MSNLGFEHAINRLGVPFDRAKVGDRYVLEKLHQRGWQLGGENSGHIICLDCHTTGDGIVSALQVLAALKQHEQTLAEACADAVFYPQQLINVPLSPGFEWANCALIEAARQEAVRELADTGRVLLRASGTEPLLRVMVEGRDESMVARLANYLADSVREAMSETQS